MIDFSSKIPELRKEINKQLLPLINNNYIYLDLPYHDNIGDTMIWEGTRLFLKQIPYKCLYSSNYKNYIDHNISSNTIILFHGGGNWGDLWEVHHNFRKRIIKKYPNNPIIILPQTVYYKNINNLYNDASFFNDYPNVTICTRDTQSYNILNTHFKNNILLVPDMAFFINIKKKKNKLTNKILFLKRNDKELNHNNNLYSSLPVNAESHDWPSVEWGEKQPFYPYRLYYKCYSLILKVEKIIGCKLEAKFVDLYWNYIFRPYYISLGYKFINKYSEIYSTRLHVAILSILLNKKIHIIDNSYGKNSHFINTWFKEYTNDLLIS